MSTRARLTLYQAIALTLSLVLVTGALRVLTGRALTRSMDSSLTAAIELVQVDQEGGVPTFAQQGDVPSVARGLVSLELYSSAGDATGRLGPGGASLPAPTRAGFATVGTWRTETVARVGGWLRAYRSMEGLRTTLRAMDRLILTTIPAMVILATLVGLWLTGQALRPVEVVARTARAIAGSGDPAARVPRTRGTDEMTRLIDVVNTMLESLERVILRERGFANAVAHELRTPVAILDARTSLALEQKRSASEYRDVLSHVHHDVVSLKHTIESLVALARTASIRQTPQDLAQLTAAAVEDIEPAVQSRHIAFHAELEPTPVDGDGALLGRALAAILDNAAKYTPDGGRIAVRCAQDGGEAVCEVDDSGPGIPADQRERMMEPFQRGYQHQAVPGSGLGLAVAQQIVQAHGGTLKLGDGRWTGLRVGIRLPLTAGDDGDAPSH